MKLIAALLCASALAQVPVQIPAGSEVSAPWTLVLPNGANDGVITVSGGFPIGTYWHPGPWLIPASGLTNAPGTYTFQQSIMFAGGPGEFTVQWSCDNSCRLYDNGVEIALAVPDMDSVDSIISTFKYSRQAIVRLMPGPHVLRVVVKNFEPGASPVGFYMKWSFGPCQF